MKAAIHLALAGAALISSVAHANTLLPTSNTTGGAGSDLILFVEDTATANYYAWDTGATLDSVETAAQIQTAQGTGPAIAQTSSTGTLAYNGSNITLSASLASFISSTGAANDVWAIDAGDSTNTNTNHIGSNRLLVSSVLSAPSWAGNASASSAKSGVSILNGLIGVWNNQSTPAPDTSTSAGWGTGTYGVNGPHGFIGSNPDSGAAIGAAQTLFLISGSGSGSNPGNIQATSGTFTLNSNGTLSYNSSAPPVPLPGAVWLLGSGLFGLVGVSRRRRA
jgi:hypothetical protein